MRLKELKIQGFKSFPDRTQLLIGAGITGVVGPNGSGKSNIADAIRWVMGETSSRRLRGAGKMEDVIFGGTRSRNPMGFAAVYLTIDNQDHGLAVEADEVTIGRRYYRSGESEYSVNGQSVRLRDLYELLLDTGLGRDGYAVVGQGRIAEIVAAKSSDRREIFEEASGISRYRFRKNEAERRLADAQGNLERLGDILGELESRIGPLKTDSEKAQSFLALSARRKSLEVTLWVDAIRRAQGSAREQLRRYEAAQAEYNRICRQLTEADDEIEALRGQTQQRMVDIEKANADIRVLTQALADTQSKLAVWQSEDDNYRTRLEVIDAELQRADLGRDSLEAQEQTHRQAIAELREKLDKRERMAEQLREQIRDLEQEAQQSGTQKEALEAASAGRQADGADARVRLAALDAAAQAVRERCEQMQSALASADAEQRQYAASALAAKQKRKEAQDAVRRAENIRDGVRLKLESRKKQTDEATQVLQQLEKVQAADQQHIRLLQDLERSLDGYQQSVKAVMRAADVKRLRGIIGPVADILTVKKGYETAIETALGYAVQNIVVENEASARAAIRFLKSERAGRATFLPLDTVQGNRFSAPLPDNAVLAADLVQTAPQYATIVNNLLGRILVVEDLNEAGRAAKALQYRCRVVTRDGQIINAGGSFTGGSTARGIGVFSRRQELEELQKRVQKRESERDAAEREALSRKAQMDTLAAQLTGAESECVNAAADALRAEMELDRLTADADAAQKNADALRDELEQQQGFLKENEIKRSAIQIELEKAQREQNQLEKQLSELGESDSERNRQHSDLLKAYDAMRFEYLSDENEIRLQEAALESLSRRGSEEQARVQQLQAEKAEALAHIEENKLQRQKMDKEQKENSLRIAEREKSIDRSNQERLQIESEISRLTQQSRALSDDRDRMSGEMARLAERKTAAQNELDTTAAKLWEEYQLTEDEAKDLMVPFESLTDLRRQVTEVRAKIRALGNVNVGAIDEYRAVKKRRDTLKAQLTDTENAKAELLRMIRDLTQQMDALFKTNFKRINENFGSIFQELFGGGSARLYLSDESDALNAGIEIEVNPPGKVIKNLSALSGGEQALVAICIYFAILGVNPSPFCILDEIDAALDDVNVKRYAQFLRRMAQSTQFIVITHRRGTMEAADVLYGVTMQEDGVSKILRLDLESAEAQLVT